MLVCHVNLRSREQQLLFIQTVDVMWAITNFFLHQPSSFETVLATHMRYHK